MKQLFKVSVGVGILTLGIFALGKKTGFFENDEHLYEEYDTSK